MTGTPIEMRQRAAGVATHRVPLEGDGAQIESKAREIAIKCTNRCANVP
jgi:hypothetical protein